MFCSLHVNRELANGALAVGHQVILACAWELIHVSIERLEVEVSPHATDVVDMVAGIDCKKWEKTKTYEKTYLREFKAFGEFLFFYHSP